MEAKTMMKFWKEDSRPRLCRAIAGEGVEAVRRYLSQGDDVNERTADGVTALHFATCSGREEIGRLLLEAGADVHAVDEGGDTPLHAAAERGNEAVVRALLLAGSDVDARHGNDWTALHDATISGYAGTVQILLEAGADVDAEDNSGSTPLALAAYKLRRAIDVYLSLLSRNANPNVPAVNPFHFRCRIRPSEFPDTEKHIWGDRVKGFNATADYRGRYCAENAGDTDCEKDGESELQMLRYQPGVDPESEMITLARKLFCD